MYLFRINKKSFKMKTLAQVYTAKGDRKTINKVIETLEQNSIEVFTHGIRLDEPHSADVLIFVNSHEHDKAEILLHDIYFPEKEKLLGEFITFEVRNEIGELTALNVFYDGILQHTHKL
jgi:hypothetical protein